MRGTADLAIICYSIAIAGFLVAIVATVRLRVEGRRQGVSPHALRQEKGARRGPELRRLSRLTNGGIMVGILGLLGGVTLGT